MDKAELKEILDKHLKWLRDEPGGSRADLRGAYLRGVDLSDADLRGADLGDADLRGAYLRGADLSGADLFGADLRGAYLLGADLRGANISVELVNQFYPLSCPESGSFVGWKKCRDELIVKLEILETAKRSSAFGRKCRCSAAKVLCIENTDGTPENTTEAVSVRDSEFVYRVGEIVSVEDFDEDRRNECSTGIHFFITRQEAVDYVL